MFPKSKVDPEFRYILGSILATLQVFLSLLDFV